MGRARTEVLRRSNGRQGGNLTSATGKLEQQPLRRLQVVAPAMVGGLEQVVRALAAGLVRRGHVVHVLVVLDDRDQDHSFLRLLGACQAKL